MIPADARHLRRMLDCIAAMRTRTVSLVRGADSLLFLRDALEVVEVVWADDFTFHVATLESAGTASTEQVASMGSQYPAIVANALDTLEGMVRSRLPDGLPPAEEVDSDR